MLSLLNDFLSFIRNESTFAISSRHVLDLGPGKPIDAECLFFENMPLQGLRLTFRMAADFEMDPFQEVITTLEFLA